MLFHIVDAVNDEEFKTFMDAVMFAYWPNDKFIKEIRIAEHPEELKVIINKITACY